MAKMSAAGSTLEDIIAQVTDTNRLAVVTSGGTCVPLDQRGVRFLDNFSTGRRGSRLTEELLRRGYYVVYIHREGNCMPFLREAMNVGNHMTLMDALKVGKDGAISFEPSESRREIVRGAIEEYHKYKDRVVLLGFREIEQYRIALEKVCRATKHLKARVMYFLAAAVGDFEMPVSQMPVNKVSSEHDISINLVRTQKMRHMIRAIAGVHPTLCCFKLETDMEVAAGKARMLLEEPTLADAVVLNILDERYSVVELVFPHGKPVVLHNEDGDIDEGIVTAIVEVQNRKLSSEASQ